MPPKCVFTYALINNSRDPFEDADLSKPHIRTRPYAEIFIESADSPYYGAQAGIFIYTNGSNPKTYSVYIAAASKDNDDYMPYDNYENALTSPKTMLATFNSTNINPNPQIGTVDKQTFLIVFNDNSKNPQIGILTHVIVNKDTSNILHVTSSQVFNLLKDPQAILPPATPKPSLNNLRI